MQRAWISLVAFLLICPQIALAAHFTDVPDDAWYVTDLSIAQQKGWVTGYKDAHGFDLNLFGPQDIVTIGQALKVTQRAAGLIPKGEPCSGCDWAQPYAALAQDAYISLNLKDLHRYATRSEVVAMVGNAFHLEKYHSVNFKGGEGTSPGITNTSCASTDSKDSYSQFAFSDVPDNFRLCAIISYLRSVNVIHGDDVPAGSPAIFRPHDAISRAEFVRIVVNGWVAFSENSPYATVQGPTIDVAGIHAQAHYDIPLGGKWRISNNEDDSVILDFSPPLFKDQSTSELIDAHTSASFNLTDEVVSGVHVFVIRNGSDQFKGVLTVLPDPLKR